MTRLYGFPPVANKQARILILGSMPSQASLEQQQYYAHPRNSFWFIMHELFGEKFSTSYQRRCALLKKHHIALWDVLASCTRQGSLDSNIRNDSIIVNDFVGFLAEHKHIQSIFFNGAKAEQAFKKHVWPLLNNIQRQLHFTRLPSTSPAHASLSAEAKRQQWAVIKEGLHG